MIVNGIAASKWGASLSEKLITPAGVNTTMQDGIPSSRDNSCKKIYIKVLFENTTRDLVEKAISDFSTIVSQTFTLQVPNKDTYFKCEPAPLKIEETGFNDMLYVTSEFNCIEHEKEKTVTSSERSFSFDVSGNIKAPAIVEIIPDVTVNNLVITGLGEEIIIKNVVGGKTTIIDAEEGTVTQDGINHYKHYESWDFPCVSVGTNNVSLNQTGVTVNIKYKARWN